MSWLLRNWHLKLAAVGLATILYTGFVYSGSFSDQDFPGLPIQAVNQPDGAYPLTQSLGTVSVQYRLAASADRVTDESFSVTVDLATYDMARAPQPQALAVHVDSLQDGVEVLSFTPATAAVALDRIAQRSVRVEVETGLVPDGLAIDTPRLSADTVTASGPQSQLGRVARAVARVQVFESGIDVRQPQVNLVPVDVDGREVQAVELTPATVSVEIDVRAVETTKTVPIRPVLSGTPAGGSEVTSVTVDPAVVTIFGMPQALESVDEVATRPISIAGASQTLKRDAELVMPDGTRTSQGEDAPVVTIAIEPAIATRTLVVGVDCRNAPNGSTCLPQQSQLALTVRGRANLLAGLDPADVTPILDASGLGPGQHRLTPTVSLPNGVSLVSISPGSVTVVIQAPATPSP
ncbi:MAG TPA: CdaR family protein [Candidatus Limnocylindria bacterium]|nr:CdaR family protein [Candidatus Limnocylindria bacterium]